MFSRFGLRFRMAASYVLVSAAAVLLVEAVVLAVTVPRIVAANRDADRARQEAAAATTETNQAKAAKTALELASRAGASATALLAQEPGHSDADLLAAALGRGGPLEVSGPGLHAAVATTEGRVLRGGPADVFPAGSMLPAEALHLGAGPARLGGADASWAAAPVEVAAPGGERRRIGVAYVVLSAAARVETPTGSGIDKSEVLGGADKAADKAAGADPDAGSSLVGVVAPAAFALVLLLPVGALFGLLSTGRLIRRVRRLADGTAAMAGGDLDVRIPTSGGDEVGRLESAFNTMAAGLAAAREAQRAAVGAQARQAERARIARELHDAISQDLFSASLLAGGLRRALPPATELQRQAAAMEASLGRTMREMRAMLLELRPIALEDAGLAEAIGELCRAYEERVGVRISTAIAELPDDPAIEHAVLRVTQEALSNAIRHGDPEAVELRIEPDEGAVAVTVRDDGRGFDPSTVAERHGMGLRLMRERAAEFGGTVEVHSAPGRGTTLRVRLPIGV